MTHSHEHDDVAERLRALGGADPFEEWFARTQTELELFGEAAAGPTVGRYVLKSRIDAGAMGTVYRGFDPELSRDVAIKIIPRAPTERALDRDRSLREARALALVSHPNVVAVHDVGVVSDGLGGIVPPDSVYVVMELLQGQSLREWIAVSGADRFDDALEILCAVGRGLACAHRSGVVHGDVKPANVHVGTDGRVSVVDFGLARTSRGGLDSHDSTAQPSSEDTDASQTSVGGTPPYMAPELRRREDGAGARADQFAFCVMAAELLFGERPCAGRLAPQIVASGPDHARARAISRVLERGLATDPSARFDSMDALVEQLTATKRRPRWIRRLGLAGSVACALGVGLMLDPTEACPSARDELSAHWNPSIEARIAAALEATGAPHAQEAWSVTRRHVEHFVASWTEAYSSTCTGSDPVESYRPQRRCLSQQLLELSSATRSLENMTAPQIHRAPTVGQRLPQPSECLQGSELARLGDGQSPAALRLDEALRDAKSSWSAGQVTEALDAARRVAERAEAAELVGLEAAARSMQCQVAMELDIQQQPREGPSTRDVCTAALTAAERLDDPVESFHAQIRLAMLETRSTNDFDQTRRSLAMLEARLEAFDDGPKTTVLRASLLDTRSLLEMYAGDDALSLELAQAGLRLLRTEYEPEDPRLVQAQANLGAAYMSMGRMEEGHQELEQALRIAEASLGAHHPLCAKLHTNLGTAGAKAREPRGGGTTFPALDRHPGPSRLALVLDHVDLGPTRARPTSAGRGGRGRRRGVGAHDLGVGHRSRRSRAGRRMAAAGRHLGTPRRMWRHRRRSPRTRC